MIFFFRSHARPAVSLFLPFSIPSVQLLIPRVALLGKRREEAPLVVCLGGQTVPFQQAYWSVDTCAVTSVTHSRTYSLTHSLTRIRGSSGERRSKSGKGQGEKKAGEGKEPSGNSGCREGREKTEGARGERT
mmetsp:Transcript_25625/g.50151  ORF Transcript_25625/g.50151 Transcript_25625/m.50151 type:complete len:132 (-) Transcript_25625:1639-2034(-)